MRGAPFLGWILVRGMWCADFGPISVHGASFLGSILVRGAPFLGWILVRGVRCADFGPISVHGASFLGSLFGVWRAVFDLDFGARCVVRRFWGRFRCTVRLFGFDFGALPFLGSILVRGALMSGSITAGNKIYPDWRGPGARCAFSGWVLAVRRFWARFWWAVRDGFWCSVCGAPILGPISVHGASFLGSLLVRGALVLGSILVRGVWCADFRADFGARCAFLGSQDWRGPGGNRSRDLSNMGPWSWRMRPFQVDFGARCAFSGSVLVCGAPFLRWILVRGAPFLGSILVRGVWCADFGADFGARCAFLGSFLVCGVRFLGSILVHGVWCADFGADLAR